MEDRVDRRSDPHLASRDVIADEAQVEQAEAECQVFSANNVFSCFPTNGTSIPQHQIASFVWNSNLPQFTQNNLVNVYLYDAANNQILKQWLDQPNPRGRPGVIRTPVNDTWLGSRGSQWNGKNATFLFYFVVTRTDVPAASGTPQAIFTAVQTTFADSVAASMSSTSAAAAASSRSAASLSSVAASLSSRSAASASLTARPTSSGGAGDGNVQSGSQGAPFPHWAIAVIVVLGTLALLACVILVFFILRRVRSSRNSDLSHRGSMGSSAPMMANAQTGNAPQSPLLAGAVLASAGATGSHRPNSPDMHDGASTVSRGSESAPFSGADAAVIADAFRTTLRKFNFADRPVMEGDSPDEEDPGEPESLAGSAAPHLGEIMLSRQLAEEGRDIRSVSSSRGVKVETLSDHDTEPYQDRPR